MSRESSPSYTSRASISEERAIERVKEMLMEFYVLFRVVDITAEEDQKIDEIWTNYTKDFCETYFSACRDRCIRKCKTMPTISDFLEESNNYESRPHYSNTKSVDYRYTEVCCENEQLNF